MIATAAVEVLSDYHLAANNWSDSDRSVSLYQLSDAWVSALSVELFSKPISVGKARTSKLRKYKNTYKKREIPSTS